ncbi:Uncharacterised protein [Mycobacteroides abscessus subsp. abscessus]|nr:Uncharacterised protein [Mycobacteroides abscessus subsp. abscessus]
MDERIKGLLKNVQEECEGRTHISDIEPFAFGVENCVFKGYSPEWGKVAIRTPWSRQIDRETDTISDSRVGLLKEYALTGHGRKYCLPVPAICPLKSCQSQASLSRMYTSHWLRGLPLGQKQLKGF